MKKAIALLLILSAILILSSCAFANKEDGTSRSQYVELPSDGAAPLTAAPTAVDPLSPEPTALATETPTDTPEPATEEPTEEPLITDTPAPTQSVPEGCLTDGERTLLVNFENRLPDGYVPHDLVNAREFFAGLCETKLDTTKIQFEVAVQFKKLLEAAREDGITTFRLNNAYRTMRLQWEMWEKRRAQNPHYGDDPYSNPVGTMPGDASEHVAGLALDICSVGYPHCDRGFLNTKECRWLYENAYKFGFILRYTEEKEHLTGVHAEPWHFRYVGVELALELYESGLCLEEYFAH